MIQRSCVSAAHKRWLQTRLVPLSLLHPRVCGGAELGPFKSYRPIDISHDTANTMPIDPPVSDPPAPNEVEVASEETLHFDYPGSDIVLRSCDSHDFSVPKLYIANSSPILRELIRSVRSVPNTSDVIDDEEQEPLPVVKLPESGATLYSLLTFIFPVIPTLPSIFEKVMELLAAAQKYQMDSILDHIRSNIARQDPPFIRPETAHHIYLLAQQHELHQEALQAARVTLRLPMTIEDLGGKFEFHGMTGAYLHVLWKYHERVRIDLKSGLLEFRNSGLPNYAKGLYCQNFHDHSYRWGQWDNCPPHSSSLWLDNYIKSIADAPHLFDLVEFENAYAHHQDFRNRSHIRCSRASIHIQVIRSFWGALTAVVHSIIKKVRRIDVTQLHRDN